MKIEDVYAKRAELDAAKPPFPERIAIVSGYAFDGPRQLEAEWLAQGLRVNVPGHIDLSVYDARRLRDWLIASIGDDSPSGGAS